MELIKGGVKMIENRAETLLAIYNMMNKHIRGKRISQKDAVQNIIKIIIDSGRKCLMADLHKFSFTLNGNHRWHGVIYTQHNQLMGSIFSYYDNKVIVLAGYPKIKYVEDVDIQHKDAYCEDKLDGTNLKIWVFHDGYILGSTRLSPNWEQQGYKGIVWKDLVAKTQLLDKLTVACKEGYEIFGELYGKLNPGEFIPYSFDIKFTVIEICNLKTFGFVSREDKETLCHRWGLPLVNKYWSGELTQKEIERMLFEMKSYLKIDGLEGLVAKLYLPDKKDTILAKIKCDEVREKCWSLSGGRAVPRTFIMKAIKKAKENFTSLTDRDQLVNFIVAELNEEFESDMITRSLNRIRNCIKDEFTNPELNVEITKFLEELYVNGEDMSTKGTGTVMRKLALKFIGFDSSKLFSIFNLFRQQKGIIK
jgi:ATP-dependent RNA circularization protein (DNA/RNA ligase family)